ncbi:uncharacterized protein N7482_006996 [Penicillium canariense]|uniref:Uncharacterized protein n=1 Tax=Penicillium canariense TaxID=189055 RepID=A0A9W9LIP5_9EURO|nr:uncharacterized protein N7482_006996 [Penicillium canariense]KAJ5159992.1 hypothetical protein N7482_006996 [Penicillium canariense]
MTGGRGRDSKPPGFYSEGNLAAKRRKVEPPEEEEGGGDEIGEEIADQGDLPMLGFDESYVGTPYWTPPAPPERPARQTWPTPEEPITYACDPRMPRGWHYDEPDLDPNDLDAQIIRCDERIANQILSDWFVRRKKELERLKEERDTMIEAESGSPGLSLSVIRRLDVLKDMERQLQAKLQATEAKEAKKEEDRGHLSNIIAIMAAYRSRELEWNPGLVTYWSHGVQLCQPRPFHYEEFLRVNQEHNGHTGFWVEGLTPLDSASEKPLKFTTASPAAGNFIRDVSLVLRLPHCRDGRFTFGFEEDSGADIMSIYDADMDYLREQARMAMGQGGFHPLMPPMLGACSHVTAAGGAGFVKTWWAIEVNMTDTNGAYMTSWDWTPCTLTDNTAFRPCERLSGPWLRYKLYMGSAPDGTGVTHIFNLKGGFKTRVPTIRPNILNATRPWAYNATWAPAQVYATYPKLPPAMPSGILAKEGVGPLASGGMGRGALGGPAPLPAPPPPLGPPPPGAGEAGA